MSKTKETNAYEAFIEFQANKPNIPKNGVGQSGNRQYPYATLPDMEKVLYPVLSKLGLIVLHFTEQTENGLLFTSKLVYRDGLVLNETKQLYPIDNSQKGIKAFGSSLTYATRYNLKTLLAIEPDIDTDGDLGNDIENIKHFFANYVINHEPDFDQNQFNSMNLGQFFNKFMGVFNRQQNEMAELQNKLEKMWKLEIERMLQDSSIKIPQKNREEAENYQNFTNGRLEKLYNFLLSKKNANS